MGKEPGLLTLATFTVHENKAKGKRCRTKLGFVKDKSSRVPSVQMIMYKSDTKSARPLKVWILCLLPPLTFLL